MKTSLSLKIIFMLFALFCISANAQSTKRPITNQYVLIVQKLSKDIVLSDQQKNIIKAKTDSVFQKHQNKEMGMKDTLYMKDMNTLRKDIIDNVLNSDQKKILLRKLETVISRHKSSN